MKKALMLCLSALSLVSPVLASDLCTRDALDGGYVHMRDEGHGEVSFEYCLRDVPDSCYGIGASRYERGGLGTFTQSLWTRAEDVRRAKSAGAVFSGVVYGAGYATKAPFLIGIGLGGLVASSGGNFYMRHLSEQASLLDGLMNGRKGCIYYDRSSEAIKEDVRGLIESVAPGPQPMVAEDGSAKIIIGDQLGQASTEGKTVKPAL